MYGSVQIMLTACSCLKFEDTNDREFEARKQTLKLRVTPLLSYQISNIPKN